MISISTFKAHPELPELALSNHIKMELNKLVESLFYDEQFITDILNSPNNGYYNSAHGPFYDLIPGSSDIEVSELCFIKFKRAINACELLGINNLIFHTGWQKDFYTDKIWFENSIRFWGMIMKCVSPKMNIYIENVFETDPYLLSEIVKGVNQDNFKICLDIGHLNLIVPDQMEKWIIELNELIGHLHIHNNFGKVDNHNGLDNGIINMNRILPLIRDNCYTANWNLEIRNNFQSSIDIIKRYKTSG